MEKAGSNVGHEVSGGMTDESKPRYGVSRVLKMVFVVMIMAMLLVPFVGMPWARSDAEIGKVELASFPQILTADDASEGVAENSEASLNVNYLSDLGSYFEDHYAYRPYLIDANSRLYTGLLSTSPVEKAIYGQNGWLYFNGTLSDYLGLEPLTEEQAAMIAHNLALVQEYVENSGGDFLFCVAPDKNSLYAQNMPARYIEATNGDWTVLAQALDTAGVSYVDLHEVLQSEINANPETLLYYLRDTHWNALGARIAYNAIMDSLQLEHESYSLQTPKAAEDYQGDIAAMLYPVSADDEIEYVYNYGGYTFLTSATDIENDGWVVAGAASKTATDAEENGTLLMFRDSFTNALFPFFAGEFKTSFYSKLTPYNLANVDRFTPNHVVIELAQRNLSNLYTDSPVMVGPSRNAEAASMLREGKLRQAQCSVTTEVNGDYTVFTVSTSDVQVGNSAQPLIRLKGSGTSSYLNYCEPFWIESDSGIDSGSGIDSNSERSYAIYVRTDTLPVSGYSVELLYS